MVQYVKFILKLDPTEGAVGDEPVELAFLDCKYSPTSHPTNWPFK